MKKSPKDSSPLVSFASEKGPRKSNEDRYVFTRIDAGKCPHGKGQILAVMDGAGGDQVVQIVADNLAETFKVGLAQTKGAINEAYLHVFDVLDALTKDRESLSTLSVVYIPDDEKRAYSAALGDSPIVIRNAEGAWSGTPPHNVRENPYELKQVLARGAQLDKEVMKITDPQAADELDSGVLRLFRTQLTRALGVNPLRRVLLRKPELFDHALGEGSVVLVGSDGIYDAANLKASEGLKHLVGEIEKGLTAEELVANALETGVKDNVTAILWRVPPKAKRGIAKWFG